MKLSEIGTIYRQELTSALRERTIVVNGILVPIFLYPVLLWATFSGLVFVEGVNDGFTSRVALDGELPAAHAALVDSLERTVTLVGERGRIRDPAARLAAGELDALIRFTPPPPEGARLEDNFSVRIVWDRAESRSGTARDRVHQAIERYRNGWFARTGEALGLGRAARGVFALEQQDISTRLDLGQLLLGQMLSIFLIVMVALGCFIPAIDTTAGERERNTWETLMTVGASRSSILVAKYLHVATLGVLAGVLNVVALMVSIGAIIEPLTRRSGLEIDIALSPAATFVILLGAIGLALFFAAGMMVLASFARSFKDGQAMVAPVYWLVFLPILLGGQVDPGLGPETAFIPIVNVSMMLRDAVRGLFAWEWISITLLVTLGTVALCLFLARQLLRFEELLTGSFDGSFWQFARRRLFTR